MLIAIVRRAGGLKLTRQGVIMLPTMVKLAKRLLTYAKREIFHPGTRALVFWLHLQGFSSPDRGFIRSPVRSLVGTKPSAA